MSAAGDFIDESLQYESSWERAEEYEVRWGSALTYYGASVGAVRGTLRNAARKFPGQGHDDVTALASELWSRPVYERRLAAVVLLQTATRMLRASDLTRIEGFVRSAGLRELVDPLAVDVVGTLLLGLGSSDATRARAVLERWATAEDPWLLRAAILSHLPAFRVGTGDDAAFRRTVRLVSGAQQGRTPEVEEALALVRAAADGGP